MFLYYIILNYVCISSVTYIKKITKTREYQNYILMYAQNQ